MCVELAYLGYLDIFTDMVFKFAPFNVVILWVVFQLAVEIVWSVRELPVAERPFYTHHR